MGDTLFLERFEPTKKSILGPLHDLYVYVDGSFSKGDAAATSVWDHGLLYGDGVVEGIRLYEGGIFKLDDHIRRLFYSCRMLGIEVPLNDDELRDVICTVIQKNSLRNAHIRPMVTRGVGEPAFDPRRSPRASVIVMAYPFESVHRAKKLRLMVTNIRRKAPQSIDARIKSLNYLDSVLAKLQANAAGYDDAVMLDGNGLVAEVATSNIFIVRDGRLFTPPTLAALPGITRETVFEIGSEAGYEVTERVLTVGDLWTADEMFVTGTGAEIVPAVHLDGREIGDGEAGPVSKDVISRYRDMVLTRYRTEVNQGAR